MCLILKRLTILEYRNQMNLASAFLDGSAVYGSTESAIQDLRTYDAGLVNVSACAACHTNALYSAILREHNRVAINLAQLNRHWTDETLFLESRRIVVAEIQHITYNEFLPTILDDVRALKQSTCDVLKLSFKQVITTKPSLLLLSHGHYTEYSSSHRAGVYNEVALSALPALLSMVPGSLVKTHHSLFSHTIK